ncbi:sigma-54-dependent transcriptional regulator [Blastomonas marina]|nr:sigma-54 dependent transcriptional regulator [Blastomonas marina]
MLDSIPVYLVEDEAELARATQQALELEGATVRRFARADQAIDAIDGEFGGVVVSDIRLPGMDGLAFFAHLREIDDAIPVILVTGHGDVDMAVDALRKGAFDFLAKPFSSERLVASIAHAAAHRRLVLENRALRARYDRSEAIPGVSPASERLRSLVAAVAKTDVDVVIRGPAGSGKSFIAGVLHELGPRRARPLVTIDAGTTLHPDAELLLFGRDPAAGLSHTGLIERARGGTLVLDEIDVADDSLRARLASFIEGRTIQPLGADRRRRVDLRIVEIAAAGSDGADPPWLHRSGPVEMQVPSLGERREDIAEFLSLFLARHERAFETESGPIGTNVLDFIHAHEWAGNLRELDAFAKRIVMGLGFEAGADVPEPASKGLRERVAAFERRLIEDALRETDGSVADTEALLKVPTKTLYDKLARHGIKPKQFRARRHGPGGRPGRG